jgi:hypothetical protein
MSRVTQHFQPPLYWQQFEDLTEGVFRYTYDDPKPQKIGRPGQSQDGVDVVGRFRNETIAIQCKRMEELDENNHPLPGGAITASFLDKSMKEAQKFKPQLDIWILATTAKRDAKIQSHARVLDSQSRNRRGFGVQLWFWDDYITELNRHHDLQRWYYDQVIQVRSGDDQDRLILEMLREAFARAAFRSPLHQESPAEFIQALKDTQCAINTGQLKDRETRRVIRQVVGGRQAVEDHDVGEYLRVADERLQQLRDLFQENLEKRIRKSGALLDIDPVLVPQLDGLRRDAIAAVNDALKHAGLKPI